MRGTKPCRLAVAARHRDLISRERVGVGAMLDQETITGVQLRLACGCVTNQIARRRNESDDRYLVQLITLVLLEVRVEARRCAGESSIGVGHRLGCDLACGGVHQTTGAHRRAAEHIAAMGYVRELRLPHDRL